MNKKIKIFIVIIVVAIISVVVWLLSINASSKVESISDIGSINNPDANLLLEYPSIEKSGFGIIDRSICYLDLKKNLRLFDGKSHKIIKQLSYENAHIISNGESCLVSLISENKFNSILLTRGIDIIQYQDLATEPQLNSGNYRICKDENCNIVDSKGGIIKNFPSTTLISTPESDGIYFEITNYDEEYGGGYLSKVINGKASRIVEINESVLSLYANKNMALLTTETAQFSSSLLINAKTNNKYELVDVDPRSIAKTDDGFIYASKSGDIGEANYANNIYLLTANGERKPVLVSIESDEKTSYNINNLVFEQGNNIIYWQDSNKVLSVPYSL